MVFINPLRVELLYVLASSEFLNRVIDFTNPSKEIDSFLGTLLLLTLTGCPVNVGEPFVSFTSPLMITGLVSLALKPPQKREIAGKLGIDVVEVSDTWEKWDKVKESFIPLEERG